MAHIEDRWYRTVVVEGKSTQVPKPGCGKGMRYRVRYLTPDGKEKSESFPDKRKRDAQAFLARVLADILKGEIFGVSPDDLDATRPVLHVVRQVKVVRQRLVFALP